MARKFRTDRFDIGGGGDGRRMEERKNNPLAQGEKFSILARKEKRYLQGKGKYCWGPLKTSGKSWFFKKKGEEKKKDARDKDPPDWGKEVCRKKKRKRRKSPEKKKGKSLSFWKTRIESEGREGGNERYLERREEEVFSSPEELSCGRSLRKRGGKRRATPLLEKSRGGEKGTWTSDGTLGPSEREKGKGLIPRQRNEILQYSSIAERGGGANHLGKGEKELMRLRRKCSSEVEGSLRASGSGKGKAEGERKIGRRIWGQKR